ncbi:hypothetical protein ACFRFH_15765 [Leifsonia sp. NPDC056824]|uniref:hypothetical protein n=1 Tax=Leifsonia sp. NPDC056824 TaxID=3345953 RepID=UPI0036B0721A
MTAALNAVGRWFERGDFTPRDVAIFRIVFSLIMLAGFPQFHWAADYPQTFFRPPWGPFALLGGFPPVQVLFALEALLAVALVSLLVGYFTRTASVIVSIVAIVGLGYSYSLGKVDHTMYLWVAPLFLLFAGWGDALSIDALRRGQRRSVPATTPQWPLRLYAVVTASAMLTAALPKISNGWLAPGSSATYASLVGEYFGNERTAWLAGFFVGLDVPFLWEALDWLTVIAEAALVVLVFTWRSRRIGLAILCLFHVGVLLTLTIAFWQNVVAYGAFLLWSRVPWPTLRPATRRWPIAIAPVVVIVGGLGAWWAVTVFGPATPWLGPVLVLTGGAVGIGYLATLAVRLLGWFTRSRGSARLTAADQRD